VVIQCLVELQVPVLKAAVVKGVIMRQTDKELEEMTHTLVMVADRLRPLIAEDQNSLRIEG
jgi:hypothetical protein